MPDTFANPYTDSPIGAALRNLSSVITRGPDQATNVLRAEAALKLKRENENHAGVGGMLRQFGTPGFDQNAAVDMAVRAGISPAELGGFQRLQSATRYGAADPRTDNAAVGAGASYGSTAQAFNTNQANETQRTQMGIAGADRRNQATIAEQRYQFDNKPMTIGTDTGPVIARQQDAYGQPAVEDLGKVKGDAARRQLNSPGGLASADPTTQRFIGAAGSAGTPRMWVNPDGSRHMTTDNRTDALTNEPLVPGGSIVSVQGDPGSVGLRPKVQGDLQEASIANERLKRLGAYAQSLVSPQNVGATGLVKGVAQDAAQLAQNLATGLGYTGLNDAIADLRTRAQTTGVGHSLPGLFDFDPSLPKVETAYDMLVMSAADAFAGGMNKASDRDIKIVKGIVGSPRDLFANPESLAAKMAAVNEIIGISQGVNDQQLRGSSPAAAPAAPGAANPPTAAPGAPTPASDPLASARDAISRGADRNAVIQRLQQNGINPAGL